jgi:spore germination cell wall hydrolase CwlJ-like protein
MVIRRGETARHRRNNNRLAIIGAGLALSLCGKVLAFAPVPSVQQLPRVTNSVVTLAVPEAVKARPKAKSDYAKKLRLLRLTMWGEGRDQGRASMRAIGHVVMNRFHAQRRRYGLGFIEVMWKSQQFSCWNRHDSNREAMRHIAELPKGHPDLVAWEATEKLAEAILSGRDPDNTSGATYYHTEAVKPFWRTDMKVVGVMFGHIFYKPK